MESKTEKRCTGCAIVKPLEEFHRDRNKPDGRRPRCKECISEHVRADRKRYTERTRAWRAANPDRARENARKHHAENRDRLNEQRRARRQERPHEDWEADYRKRSRAAGFVPVVRTFTREELIAYWGNGARCIYCDGPFEELDHLYPVALGAVHTVETCAPACVQCNRAGGQDARRFLRGLTERERCRQVIVGAARARLAPIA